MVTTYSKQGENKHSKQWLPVAVTIHSSPTNMFHNLQIFTLFAPSSLSPLHLPFTPLHLFWICSFSPTFPSFCSHSLAQLLNSEILSLARDLVTWPSSIEDFITQELTIRSLCGEYVDMGTCQFYVNKNKAHRSPHRTLHCHLAAWFCTVCTGNGTWKTSPQHTQYDWWSSVPWTTGFTGFCPYYTAEGINPSNKSVYSWTNYQTLPLT